MSPVVMVHTPPPLLPERWHASGGVIKQGKAMCKQVTFNGRTAQTIGELRIMLGVEPILLNGYSECDDHVCLCPCDIRATAKACGLSETADSVFGSVELVKQ
jgi:hypothetical protein